ncbi:MAG TPA: F0F1 ATP synthase subunit delta [Candidatus Babeliales bacterium]|jgi:F0F1-type ATP synthase delta subunit|nr:F0F1 ATP synthase subunit delta [Candidatus Babeliales bacterium]
MITSDTESLLVKRYAMAWTTLFGADLTENDIVHINNAADYLHKQPHLQFMFKLLIIEDTIKKEALSILDSLYHLPQGYQQLCNLLIAHKRTYLLESILHVIVQLYWQKKNVEWFTISSAEPLSDNQQEVCRLFLEQHCKKEVRCIYHIDTNLIAGIRMQSNYFLWEHSVSKDMRMMHNLLVQ